MDRAEAIKYLKISLEEIKNCGYAYFGSVGRRCLEIAIAALREREQREQGCEFCRTEYDILLPTDMGYTWISGNELQNSYGSCEIRYCPMCGRKLGGAEG